MRPMFTFGHGRGSRIPRSRGNAEHTCAWTLRCFVPGRTIKTSRLRRDPSPTGKNSHLATGTAQASFLKWWNRTGGSALSSATAPTASSETRGHLAKYLAVLSST